MSSNHHAPAGADLDAAPERYLSHSSVCGIHIGLHVICRIARALPEPDGRAMIWLHNYARLRRLTADALCTEAGLTMAHIRAALTDPELAADERDCFTAAVQVLRAKFEATIPALYLSQPTQTVAKAFRFALRHKKLVEVIGLNRTGKSESARVQYWRNLDRCVWFDVPAEESDRDFYAGLAEELGIAAARNTRSRCNQLRLQIAAVFGSGLIDTLILDEAHNLWPTNPEAKPKRLEFARVNIHRDGAVGIVVLATPQFSTSLQKVMDESPRFAPGQYDGRVVRYHLQETMSDEDLAGVARWHAPEFSDEMIAQLVLGAKAQEGFCGLMVNMILLAREQAEDDGRKAVTLADVKTAGAMMARGSRIERLAKEQLARQQQGGGTPALVPTLRSPQRRRHNGHVTTLRV